VQQICLLDWKGASHGRQRENMNELHDKFQCPYLANAVGVFFFTVQFETEHDNK
jgi:hypothetical protein